MHSHNSMHRSQHPAII